MPSVRQKQVEELIKRNFGLVLHSEGTYVFGAKPLVTVTQVKISPDFTLARIYLSIYNTDHKQEVILEMDENKPRLKQALGLRLRKQMRRVPEIDFYLDDTLDEMYRLNHLFDRLHADNQMGTPGEEE